MPINPPSVSVVVTCYNYERYVVDAVESALHQSSPAIEVVVVDDGSTDSSRALLTERYGGHQTVRVVGTENRGQLAAFSEGIRQCTGDVVCFLDADDYWDSSYLELVKNTFTAVPGIDFICSNMRYVGDLAGYSETETTDRDLGISSLLAAFRPTYVGSPTSALAVRRPLLERVLDLPGDFLSEWKTCADTVIAIGTSILGAQKYYIGAAKVNYRVHGSNAWFQHKKGRVAELRHVLSAAKVANYYRKRAGLDEVALQWAQLEFKTRPMPKGYELRSYLYLLLSSRSPITYKIWASLSMIRHFLRARLKSAARS